jgi:hypothetical protein
VASVIEVRQAGVGHHGALNVELVKVVEPYDVGQLRIGASRAEERIDDVAQDIDPDPIHDPSGPPRDAVGFRGAGCHLPFVEDPVPRAPNGRHRLALYPSTAEQPAQPAADQQDRDDEPGHAEAQITPPGAFVDRYHATKIALITLGNPRAAE